MSIGDLLEIWLLGRFQFTKDDVASCGCQMFNLTSVGVREVLYILIRSKGCDFGCDKNTQALELRQTPTSARKALLKRVTLADPNAFATLDEIIIQFWNANRL